MTKVVTLSYYGARLCTSALLAYVGWRFVSHFNLLEFPFAAYLVGCTLACAFWLFSQKYEPALIALSLIIATLLTIKASRLKSNFDTSGLSEHHILNRLSVAAAFIELNKIQNKSYPAHKDAIKMLSETFSDQIWEYCSANCPFPSPSSKSSYWIVLTEKKLRDKENTLWYIDDSFEIYSRSATAKSFTNLSAEATTRN